VVGGIAHMTVENVRIEGHARGSIAVYNRGSFRGTNMEIIGDGGAIHHVTLATSTVIRGCTIRGGQYGFVNTAPSGIDIDGLDMNLDYWASPTYEAVTATAYGALYADVSSHVEGDRTLYDVLRYLSPVTTFTVSSGLTSSLVRVWDRVEMANGTWTQVLGFTGATTAVLDDWRKPLSWARAATPSGTATVYRVTLGRLIGHTPTRLLMQTGSLAPPSPRWRSVTGDTMATPTTGGGSRLDIIRAGSSNRDVDTGGIHVTETSSGARVTNCTVRGGWSDAITLRGSGSVAEDCTTDLGQDMGYTVDGTHGTVVMRRCIAKRAGRSGFAVIGGPSKLFDCEAYSNGTINDGSGDYGFTVTAAAAGSKLQVRGGQNLDALIAGAEVTAGGFDSAAVADRAAQVAATLYPAFRGRGRRP